MGNGCSRDDDHYPCTVCVGTSVHDVNAECYKHRLRTHRVKLEHDFIVSFEKALTIAHKKHPTFAKSEIEAVTILAGEYLEVIDAHLKNKSHEQRQGELMDAMVVTYRKWIGEYESINNSSSAR